MTTPEPKTPRTETTASDMVAMLRRHYLPEGKQPAGIFAPEITAPDGTRRADLIWQGVTTATGDLLVGHEVKVSRADVLVELQDLTKTDPWQRFCDRWWLVVSDPALIDGLDLPPSWGVMSPPAGRRTRSMTVLVQAPQLKPVDKAVAYSTIAKWLHWRHYNLDIQRRVQTEEVERLRRANDDLQQRIPRESPHQRKVDGVVEQIVRGMGGVESDGQVGDWQHRVDVADVVAALRDLGNVYQRAQAIEYRVQSTLTELDRITKSINTRDIADLTASVAKIRTRQTLRQAS